MNKNEGRYCTAYWDPSPDVNYASQRRMNEWRPIETAPKDGSFVLLYDPELTAQMNWNDRPSDDNDLGPPCPAYVGFWSNHGQCWQLAHYTAFDYSPTHWQPLPDGPAVRTAG